MTDKENFVTVDLKTWATPIAVLLVGVMIALAIFFGLRTLDGSRTVKTDTVGSQAGGAAGEALPPTDPAGSLPLEVKTSIDNDPILGNRETAQIAIVEFSDYECPFCERFWRQTLGQIKENFIDSGEVILVYRDLPLSFHDPAATEEANAAECARQQGGDEVYYQFHDQIYEKTPGNGQGISEDGLITIGTSLGLNRTKLAKCIQDQEFAEEIRKDTADANKVGINGTPGFVIGKLAQDGSVEGVVISGAEPYVNFEKVINEQLQK